MTDEKKANPNEVGSRPVEATNEELLRLNLEEARLRNEKLELELYVLKAQRDQIKMDRLRKATSQETVERDLASAQAALAAARSRCSHRKGGRGMGAIVSGGTDANYALIRHQLPDTSWYIACTRCGKEWREGDEGFQEMLTAPTDNTPSAGSFFTFQTIDPATGRPVSLRPFGQDRVKAQELLNSVNEEKESKNE